ncbi:MAG: reverse transcriptase family protein [Candidatus Nitrotoga sp.]|nr:reverse transcriptase family protein [Candidatus Nitrotoga sp.]
MEDWSVHHLSQQAEVSLGADKALSLRQYAQKLRQKHLPVIFTLRHLCKITDVDYSVLRATVERRRESANYHMFSVRKRSGGRRFIHAVSGKLFTAQQFINTDILQKIEPHPASFAFHPKGGIRKCAAMHGGARWLFQYDLQNFFYDVNEVDVFHIFKNIGYRPLLAFELARICTTTQLPEHLRGLLRPVGKGFRKAYAFYADRTRSIGVLPQGAPSSPMLSNLAARELDENLFEYADKHGFVYTRYADDITLSAGRLPEAVSVGKINRSVIGIIRRCRFMENEKKTRVAGPGSKKVVLGLLVDGDHPRISKETYKRIDRHLHATLKYGLAEVASHENFDSSFGFYNHLAGLISFVKDVDPTRWPEFNERFSRVKTPWTLEAR